MVFLEVPVSIRSATRPDAGLDTLRLRQELLDLTRTLKTCITSPRVICDEGANRIEGRVICDEGANRIEGRVICDEGANCIEGRVICDKGANRIEGRVICDKGANRIEGRVICDEGANCIEGRVICDEGANCIEGRVICDEGANYIEASIRSAFVYFIDFNFVKELYELCTEYVRDMYGISMGHPLQFSNMGGFI
jgi:hypothetical protein